MLNKPAQGAQRHVTGGELLDGIRKYALNEFGPMAKTVFTAWGIRACADFGQLVFNLVNKGILGKTDQDTLQDFTHGYDFDAAFCAPYRPEPTADVKYRECP